MSFDVASEKILGIVGLADVGRTELLRLTFGADRADTGSVEVGSPLTPVRIHSSGDAVCHSISLLTESHKDGGLVLSLSITTNVALGNMLSVMK